MTLIAGAALTACAATRPYEAIAPATPDAFECALRKANDLGYTIVELDRAEQTARAELRHAAGSSTAEQLDIKVVDGRSLSVTAWLVHHHYTLTSGSPQQRTQYESPNELTIEDADSVVDACGHGASGA